MPRRPATSLYAKPLARKQSSHVPAIVDDDTFLAAMSKSAGDKVVAIKFYAGWCRACKTCLLYTSPSPRDRQKSRMPSSA